MYAIRSYYDERQKQDIKQFPNIQRYLAMMGARPDVQKAMQCFPDFDWEASLTEEALIKRIGENAKS